MEYNIEHCVNPNVRRFNFSRKISRHIEMFDDPEDQITLFYEDTIAGQKDPPEYIKKIWKIKGISKIFLGPCVVSVIKQESGDWTEIEALIRVVLDTEKIED